MNQYKNYCYADKYSAFSADQADQVPITIYSGSTFMGVGTIDHYTDQSPSNNLVANYVIAKFPLTIPPTFSYSVNRVYPSCSTIGPMTTTTGLNVDDAVILTTSIVIVWVMAYSIKVLRRAL